MMTELRFEKVYLMKHLLGWELDQQISLMRVELHFWKVLQSLMQDSTDLRPALKQIYVCFTDFFTAGVLAAGVELVELGVGIVDIRACSSAFPPPVSLILISLLIRISMSVKLEPL